MLGAEAARRNVVASARAPVLDSLVPSMPMIATSLADLLETLVNLPSVTGSEARIAEFVGQRLAGLGRGEVLRSGLSLVWRGPRRGRPLAVLAGHLDTVPPNGNATARREGGKLYGVGSSDMKAGDAVLLALIEELQPEQARFDLAAIFYDAEEGPAHGNGLARVMREMPWLTEARLAVLLEPTDLKVELGCNGAMNAEVRVRGRAAHSARPWLGVNAVERAAPWLAQVTKVPVTPVLVQGIEYKETLQITTLEAGATRNVVPDSLVANLNYRFPPDRTVEAAEERLRSLVPAEFEMEVVDRAPAGRVCLDEPEVTEFERRFGLTAGKQGWTDVARFTEAGIPAFNFGPGIAELAHQQGEYCPLENLEPAFRHLAAFLSES
jgi:succinyl-diaminopimelate desuccinylase